MSDEAVNGFVSIAMKHSAELRTASDRLLILTAGKERATMRRLLREWQQFEEIFFKFGSDELEIHGEMALPRGTNGAK